MKSVLISIQPKWVEKIVGGEKTIEVRKTRPKLETPFKCYIYCTKENKHYDLYIKEPKAREDYGVIDRLRAGQEEVIKTIDGYKTFIAHGKVIGEFVCDRIVPFDVPYPAWSREYLNSICDGACLTYGHLHAYIGSGNRGYGWHISDLKIYDKPKELSEFWTIKCTNKRNGCIDCEVKPNCIKTITRPPQSYMFVEILGE